MFGYIIVNKPELKIKEFERYHAYYCGVCRDLRELYGPAGQATLSYDLTFVAILLTALYEPNTDKTLTNCVVHPLSKHKTYRNAYTRYAAEMNLILAYHKALDDAHDDKSLKGKGSVLLLKKQYRKTVKKYHKKTSICQNELKKIHVLEKRNSTDLDALAGCFGRIMGEMLVYGEDAWAPYLRRIGFYLGKFIYLYDAWDDIEKDIASGNFNPLKERFTKNEPTKFDEEMKTLLTMMMSECAKAFETLPILRDAGLLRNILYSGVWSRFAEKTAAGQERENSASNRGKCRRDCDGDKRTTRH